MKKYRILEKNGEYRAQRYNEGFICKGWETLEITVSCQIEGTNVRVRNFFTLEEAEDLIDHDSKKDNDWQTVKEIIR